MKGTITTIILFLVNWAVAQNISIELANEYYKSGEYEKAASAYESIALDKEKITLVHARSFLNKQIQLNPTNVVYKAELAYLLELSGDLELAKVQLAKVISEASETDTYVYQLQNFFYQTNKMNDLIDLFLLSRQKMKDSNRHALHLARAYLYAGKKDKMLEELLVYGVMNQRSNSYVERTIQDNIVEEEEISMLQRMLLERIQKNPNEFYYVNLLIWHYSVQKEFMRAFTQARAIDKRLRQEGNRVFELAGLAFQNKDYRSASKMYEYLMNEYPTGDLYPACRRWFIQSKEEIVKTSFPIVKEDIIDLITQYDNLLKELGSSAKTKDAIRNMALLHGFYLGDHAKAIEILNEAMATAGSDITFRDACKIDMADIYVLKGEPWTAALLFLQVEKSQKEDKLGEEAKFKNARLFYYTGEFELAKEILDILKKATTREISNDALKLSLLIQDNLGLDTTDAALRAYAATELLLYQNRNEEALVQLDSLFKTYKNHYLADEILWSRSNILLRLDRTAEALENLNTIYRDYRFDILADDALFAIAKVTDEKLGETVEAMKLYKEMLIRFPGSILAADARKRYRELRGDFVN